MLSLTRASLLLLTVSCCAVAAPPPLATNLVEHVIAEEDSNYERAKNWEYTLHITTQRLDGEGKVVRENQKSAPYRPQGRLSYRVEGVDRQGESAEVGFGFSDRESGDGKEGASESIKMRELSPFYDFALAGESQIEGKKVWLLDFAPKGEVKTKGTRQKVLSRLRGRLWINERHNAIMRADCALDKPMPFVWLDLVSLRSLKIHYEAFHHEGRVWMPRRVEFEYLVRIFFISHIRQRQIMTADGFHELPAGERDKTPAVNGAATPPESPAQAR